MGVLRSVAHRWAESRFLWGVFIIAVHRAFVLGLGARHRGIVKLSSEGSWMCVTVFACFTYLLTYSGQDVGRPPETCLGTVKSTK